MFHNFAIHFVLLVIQPQKDIIINQPNCVWTHLCAYLHVPIQPTGYSIKTSKNYLPTHVINVHPYICTNL